jgi:hypothetical protein
MNMKDEAGLGLEIHWVQQALISAYEDNCPLRPVETGKLTLKWTAELESLRRGVIIAVQMRIRKVGRSIVRLSGITERR